MKKLIFLIILGLSLFVNSTSAQANPPQLIVDKCPEFCPPPKHVVCLQVLTPVPNKPGWWYTNSCRTVMINATKNKRW